MKNIFCRSGRLSQTNLAPPRLAVITTENGVSERPSNAVKNDKNQTPNFEELTKKTREKPSMP